MRSAVERWRATVNDHHAQSERAKERISETGDFWGPLVSKFKGDPRRSDDPLLARLLRLVSSDSTVLDVGAGAGRLALPLALRCRSVTAVEPSESMAGALQESARESGIDNVNVMQSSWEEAKVQPADIVLCAHVVYGVADIERFVRKLESSATEHVVILAYVRSRAAQFSPFWKPVHGEDRIDLPGLPELMNALWDMRIHPDLEMVEDDRGQPAETREEALNVLRRLLLVEPDTNADGRLQAAMEKLLIETPDGLTFPDAGPRQQGLVSWSPG